MLNGQLRYDLALPFEEGSSDYVCEQISSLITTCACQLISGKDYELEIAAQAVNGLTKENETADVYLYAAIEREDWQEVKRIYQVVFRPYIYKTASQLVIKALAHQI